MTDPKYAAYAALDPYFEIIRRGLAGMVDGDHYFDIFADDAVMEFRYVFPGWPDAVTGRNSLKDAFSGYGDNIVLHGADGLVVHRSEEPGVVIIEYEVHGTMVRIGVPYYNRFIAVVAIRNRKIAHWRDYMDSLAAMTALCQPVPDATDLSR